MYVLSLDNLVLAIIVKFLPVNFDNELGSVSLQKNQLPEILKKNLLILILTKYLTRTKDK